MVHAIVRYSKRMAKLWIPPPQDAEAVTVWRQHHAYPAYYGKPDGKVWSAKTGRVIEGFSKSDGYSYIKIDGKLVKRSRFNLSLSLGRDIGEAMECDHILPIKKGGGDDWANLQELTRPDHNRKTSLDLSDAGKRSGITMGVPIIARHAGTRDETRFDSVNAAIKGLGINHGLVDRSLQGLQIRRDYVFSYTPEHLAEQADLPGERWLNAVSSWGLLPKIQASDRGRIQDSRGRRSYGRDQNGYLRFGTRIDKKFRDLRVHDVIGRTFLEPPPSSKHTPVHINRDKSDNRAANLRWATPTEQGRNKTTNRSVFQLDLFTGEQLAIFGTIAKAAEIVGISACNIGSVAGGHRLTAAGWGLEVRRREQRFVDMLQRFTTRRMATILAF
jgi:hypothetical protein